MQHLAFFILSCLGAVFGSDISIYDQVTIELYKNGQRLERMWPTDDLETASPNYDKCKQPILVATGFSFGLPIFGRDNMFSTGIATSISNNSDFNVLLVNYNNSHYLTAPPIAAAQLAEFLEELSETFGVQGEDVIMAAHSMGTQVAGYLSQIFRIGTIIAFDPAGPSWDDLPNELRLDRSDTDFLVAVHTSDLVGTLRNDIGHINLFLDGGVWPNGCPDTDLICPHGRGQDIFIDSSFLCNYTFTSCNSYRQFTAGECDNNPKVNLRYDIDRYDVNIPMDGQSYYYNTDPNVGRLVPICRDEDKRGVRFYSENLCY